MPQGDNKYVNTWAGADVLVAPLGSPIPTPGNDYSNDWEFVGTLNGGQGFASARTSSQTDHFGWGRGIVAQTDKEYKETKTFTSMETTNETMLSLAYPGSTFNFADVARGNIQATLKVPSKESFMIAFVTERGGVIQRYTSKDYAQLEGWPVGSQNDTDVEQMEVTVVIYPNANGELWDYQRTTDTAAAPAAWTDTTTYSLGDLATIGAGEGEVTTAGTSGGTEPALPASIGLTVIDGTVVWTRRA